MYVTYILLTCEAAAGRERSRSARWELHDEEAVSNLRAASTPSLPASVCIGAAFLACDNTL